MDPRHVVEILDRFLFLRMHAAPRDERIGDSKVAKSVAAPPRGPEVQVRSTTSNVVKVLRLLLRNEERTPSRRTLSH